MKKTFLYMIQIILLLNFGIKSVYANIGLNQNNISLGINSSQTLTYYGSSSNDVVWASSNPNIVTVNNGIVTGISVGTASISVTDGTSTAFCTIHVISDFVAVSSIYLPSTEGTIGINETKNIGASIEPKNASTKTLIYVSSDTSIVTVDGNGNITGKKVGTARISISAEGKTVIYKVNVVDNVALKGISTKSSVEIKEQGTDKLNVTFNPSNATNKKVTWKSSDTKIVTVDGNGNIKGISAGTATITVTSNEGNFTSTTKVTVTAIDKKLKSIVLNKKELKLEVGKTETLTVTYDPPYAENKEVKWTSSNTKVATVDNGKITAIKPGVAEIKVTSSDGGLEATCKVTVPSPPIESIAFESEELTVYVDSTTTLNTISTPEDAIILEPLWTSSDETVAIVEDGVLTAKKVGTTIITISDKEKKITASITVHVVEKPEEPLMITVEGYELYFDPDTKAYTLLIGNESSLIIKTNIDESKVTIGGNRDLKNGSIITINVKRKENVTYVINIKKKSNYTLYFIGIISFLLFLNIIRLLGKNKKRNNK